MLACKAKRQYLLTCKVNRYCRLALQNSIVEAEQQRIGCTRNSVKWPLIAGRRDYSGLTSMTMTSVVFQLSQRKLL